MNVDVRRSLGGLRVRSLAAGDLDAVMAIADGLTGAPRWTREAYGAVASGQGSPMRVGLVALTEVGVIAGFVVGSLIVPEAELELIAVEAKAQGRGVGAQLLDAWLLAVQEAGAREVLLEVRESNDQARRLYGKAGFGEVGRRRGYYENPGEDAVLLRLGLDSAI